MKSPCTKLAGSLGLGDPHIRAIPEAGTGHSHDEKSCTRHDKQERIRGRIRQPVLAEAPTAANSLPNVQNDTTRCGKNLAKSGERVFHSCLRQLTETPDDGVDDMARCWPTVLL